jgi:aconitase B
MKTQRQRLDLAIEKIADLDIPDCLILNRVETIFDVALCIESHVEIIKELISHEYKNEKTIEPYLSRIEKIIDKISNFKEHVTCKTTDEIRIQERN